MRKLLVLRPQPGAEETAERAARMGLANVIAPLFEVRRARWSAPEPADFDALFVTSANALRFGGLEAFRHLPLYAVGESTAAAARAAGFSNIQTGPSDGQALLALMARNGIRRAFHPAGRDHVPLEHPEMTLERRVVYVAKAVEHLPDPAAAALCEGAVALLHSPRAGGVFAQLVDAAGLSRGEIRVAVLSAAVAGAAGNGWQSVRIAAEPRDEALLEVAAELCHR